MHLRNWLRARRLPDATLPVTLYTRVGCHLCDDALATLRAEQARFHFNLSILDVDTVPELKSRFDDCVPVVEIAGKIRFRGHVSPTLLRRLLRAESRHANRSAFQAGAGGAGGSPGLDAELGPGA